MSIYDEKKERTRKRIRETFLRLLPDKPFEAITVGDIAKRAGINRGTFYLHYTDKYDLLDQMERQLFDELGSHVGELQSLYLSVQTFGPEQEQAANALFDFIREHAQVLRLLLQGHGRAGFHIRFRSAFMEIVRDNLERRESFIADLKIPLDYFLAFVTSAFLGLIEQWIQSGLDKTPEEMTALYIGMIRFIREK